MLLPGPPSRESQAPVKAEATQSSEVRTSTQAQDTKVSRTLEDAMFSTTPSVVKKSRRGGKQ